jgi:hypothetical protein
MADYTNSKDAIGASLPLNAVEQSWERVEPLITPEQLVKRHLFGIPLASAMKNAQTGRPDLMDPETIKEFISQAVSLVEMEVGIDIFQNQYNEKHAFDKAPYDNMGFLRVRNRPVSSIQSLEIVPSNQQSVFAVPLEWVDIGYLQQGQINLIPLTIALKSGTTVPLNSSVGGATFLSIFGHRAWIASFFQVAYTTGFKDGNLPKIVNQLIGTVAAMEILSSLGATYAKTNSTSLSIDGLSQSISQPGPNLFQARLKELGEKRLWLTNKIKRQYSLGTFVDNV